MKSIVSYLEQHGPTRSAKLVSMLVDQGIAADTARQRVARLRSPVFKFPLKLLPKNESFVYLAQQRNTEEFWDNFVRDLRETNSVFGFAIDGLLARGGAVPRDQFAVICGGPANPMQKQLNAERILETLTKASFLETVVWSDQQVVRFKGGGAYFPSRDMGEMILLDALREWARKLGFASYNLLAIRREPDLQPIGPFQFDIAGPSYFNPLSEGGKPGFFVADVFSEGTLTEHHIRYFIRKVSVLRSMKMGVKLMPMLVAESFTGAALTAGHAAGISLATPTILFGRRAGAAMSSLIQTLRNAAAHASADNSDRLVRLLTDLTEIEGRAGNLRGVLFELMAAYLARRTAVSIEMGISARDDATGKKVDIDVLKVTQMSAEVTCIECKGKEPGGKVSLLEVEEWLAKIPTIRAFLADHRSLREAAQVYELWTSGTFEADALALLQREKTKRKKVNIGWKDGADVIAIARAGKEKAMADAFDQHFRRHPLAEVSLAVEENPPPFGIPLTDDLFKKLGPAPYGGVPALSAPSEKL